MEQLGYLLNKSIPKSNANGKAYHRHCPLAREVVTQLLQH